MHHKKTPSPFLKFSKFSGKNFSRFRFSKKKGYPLWKNPFFLIKISRPVAPPYMKGVFRGVTWGGKHRGDDGEGLRREVQGRGVWGCA